MGGGEGGGEAGGVSHTGINNEGATNFRNHLTGKKRKFLTGRKSLRRFKKSVLAYEKKKKKKREDPGESAEGKGGARC